MVPIVLVAVLFAGDILRIVLGGDFPRQSALVLKILALGVLVACPAQVPYSLLQGIGRPDLTAKFHLIELFVESIVERVLLDRLVEQPAQALVGVAPRIALEAGDRVRRLLAARRRLEGVRTIIA